ncbi:hypothetical protein YB2330_003282 [Saitoella coloradoensis]
MSDQPTSKPKLDRTLPDPTNPYAALITSQEVALIPEYALESGVTLTNFPVAYKTWGKLSENADNVMIICHALTGSADVEDWWGPLIGPGRAFDTSRFFIFCANSLGSPYGSCSPTTTDPQTGQHFGPEFPLVTVRDDVNIHKIVLDDLGVKQVALVVGGSMGGMLCLEWAYFGLDYVRAVVPMATSARHSAWCISWGEAQRQSIYSDPKYEDGYYSYDDPPIAGLGAARMSALLTYRSRNSFESRFGRTTPDPSKQPYPNALPKTPSEEHWAIHNEGNRRRNDQPRRRSNTPDSQTSQGDSSVRKASNQSRAPTYFNAQSYLRYQAQKFVKRFDANCYIAITRKLDTHDVSRGRADDVKSALALLQQPALVIGIESDGLFTFAEQQEIAEYMPNAVLSRIESPEGHDGFLLEFDQVNRQVLEFMNKHLPDIMQREGVMSDDVPSVVDSAKKASVFGEAEGDGVVEDITTW